MFGQSPMKKIDKTIEKASKLINTGKYPDAYQLLLKLNGTYGVYLQNYRNDEVDFMFKVCLYEIYHNTEDPRVKKAKESKPKTQEELATEYYLKGNKYEALHNDAEAIECYKKAANLGSIEAMYQVGHLFLESEHIVKDEQAGLHWIQKAADNGYKHAYNDLATLYFRGKVTDIDEKVAMRYVEKAAENGDIDFVRTVAGLYYNKGDYTNAAHFYKLAADNNDADSMYKYAIALKRMDNDAYNVYHIHKYVSKAAELKHPEARINLPTIKEAYKSFLENSSVELLLKVAISYHEHLEFEAALETYLASSAKGDKFALYTAGVLYLSDHEDVQDYQKGFEIMLKLANENYREPQEWLNKIYQGGYGIDADSDVAKLWLSKSFDSPSIFEQ